MELYSSNIKKCPVFCRQKAFLIFREMELSYILGNRNPEKIPHISGNGIFIFQEKETLKSFLYFRK